ncbi:WSC domain-containing protein [Apiosordaria backusii]|uniref:WSC domain-containing protein n=1 Tax=Apiosordaria backusii TaxID=314023 RepID=A0AA40BE57_9PEZI|nr:WSC domain-containing protein [Apiosordaria backusii]
MTVASCATFCSKFELFAVSYGRECYCGHSVTDGNTEVDAADCSFPCAGNADEKCGAGNRVNLYTNDSPSIRAPASLPGITSLGCFVDSAARILPNNIIGADDMTAAKCALNCAGYDFFGTQWSRECFCGSILPTEPAPASDCSMPCSGDDNELCGAGMRLNVYSFNKESTSTTSSEPATSSPTSVPTIDGFEYQGCYTDNVPQRVLGGKVVVDGAMTLEKCASSCKDSGYALFGVQYSSECFCGTSLDAASVQVPDTECGMACSGDQSQKCGDGNRLSLYADPTLEQSEATNLASIGEFTYRSCWTDDLGNRSLTAVEHRTDDMTVAKCADICQDYTFFGLEYGRECYCGDELVGQAALEKDCSILCVGGGNNWCGGPFRMNLYAKESVSTSVSITASTTTSIVEASTTSTVEASTTIETSTTSDTVSSTTSVDDSTSLPSSTIASSTTTTQGPSLTTITRCPPTPTWVGRPEMCYDTTLPYQCEQLASTLYQPQGMSWALLNCQGVITRYGLQPNPTTCFPTSTAVNPPDAAAATSTIRSVHSCLRSAYICTKASTCVTNTYPVGQVPVPTPTTGVELLSDGGFESGQWGNWTLTGDTTRMYGQVSTLNPRAGSYSYHIHNPNYSSAALWLSRNIAVEPGKYYRFKTNVWITNSQVENNIRLMANPAGYNQLIQLRYTTAGMWREVSFTFPATSSWLELQLLVTAQPLYNGQQWEGSNNIFVDDVSLVRLY